MKMRRKRTRRASQLRRMQKTLMVMKSKGRMKDTVTRQETRRLPIAAKIC
jgi:hypothetical protein